MKLQRHVFEISLGLLQERAKNARVQPVTLGPLLVFP